jgi:ubiquinone/menaquinone biosynthesis C-methylase UbiE
MTGTAKFETESVPYSQQEFRNHAGSCSISVTEGYERWAATYDSFPNPLLAREERHLLPLLADLSGKTILDLACGTGRWLEILLRRGAAGVGIDCSASMLGTARQKCAIASRLAHARCEMLPFRAASFDLAVCSFALGHIRELGCLVRELARVMKPETDVFVTDLHPDAVARGWRVGFRDANISFCIEVLPRTIDEIVAAFSDEFACVSHASLWLGHEEQPIFLRAGKSQAFAKACQLPAILACRFRRIPAKSDQRTKWINDKGLATYERSGNRNREQSPGRGHYRFSELLES